MRMWLKRLSVRMDSCTSDQLTSDDRRPDAPRELRGKDVSHIRAALNLYRAEFADALGVSIPTVTRWEQRGSEPVRPRGHPARVLSALRDRIVVDGVMLSEARAAGRYVAQSLLRNGKLAAGRELMHFADMRAPRRFVNHDE